jgi:hypothetical protein
MKRRGGISLVLVIVTLATFGRIVTNEFSGWDDPSTIFQNPRIVSPSLENVVYYWTHSEGGLYVPVTYTVWSVLGAVSQVDDGSGHVTLNPWAFHAASVLIHLASVLVVYQILRLLIEHELAAMFGALLFAVHPMQVEAVAWTSGAKDLLGGSFSLVAIWQYIKFANPLAGGRGSRRAVLSSEEKDGSAGASPSNRKFARKHFLFAALGLVLAMLSKPSAVAVPLVAGAIDYFLLRRSSRKVWRSILPLLLLTIPFVIIGRLVQTTPHVTDAALWTRPLVALDALAFYVIKVIWPATLGIIYGRTPDVVLKSGQIYYTWILPVILFAIGYATRKKWPPLITGESAFFFAVLPVLGLTPFMFQVHSTVADHYVYVAMLGVALILAAAIRAKPSTSIYGLANVIVFALAVRSFAQAGTWRDSITLATHAVDVAPASGTAHSNLGVALAEANRITEAVQQLEAAVQLEPNNREAHTRLAQAYLQTGRPRDAYEQAQIAIHLIESGPASTIERADRARFIRDLAVRQLFEQERASRTTPTQSTQP